MAAVRSIEYEISTNYISPTDIKKGGVQGDHNATEVVFRLTDELINVLKSSAAENKKICYRFEGFDGTGERHIYDPCELNTENRIYSFPIGNELTRYGGIVRVVFVITVYDEADGIYTDLEAYSYEAKLSLSSLPKTTEITGDGYNSLSTLAMVAKNSAQIAEDCKDQAVGAAKSTETASAALQGGTVWIFDGEGAECEIDIEIVVDNEINENSTNPVQNKKVKEYVDEAINNEISKISIPAVTIIESGITEQTQGTYADIPNKETSDLNDGKWRYEIKKHTDSEGNVEYSVEMWTPASFYGNINIACGGGFVSENTFSLMDYPVFEIEGNKYSVGGLNVCHFGLNYIPIDTSFVVVYGKNEFFDRVTPIKIWSSARFANEQNFTGRYFVKGYLVKEKEAAETDDGS